MTRQELDVLRDTIDGELNRVAVTNDLEELESMFDHLIKNVRVYCSNHRRRLHKNLNGGRYNADSN